MVEHSIIIHQNTDALGGVEFQERSFLPIARSLFGFDDALLPTPIQKNGAKGITVLSDGSGGLELSLDFFGPNELSNPTGSEVVLIDDAGTVKLVSIANLVGDTDKKVAVDSEANAGYLINVLTNADPIVLTDNGDTLDISVETGSDTQKGVVQVGDNIGVDGNGVISVAKASTSALGVAKFNSSDFSVDANGQVSLGISYMDWETTPPSTQTSTGIAGQIAYDNDYLYICVGANTWKRTSLAKWS